MPNVWSKNRITHLSNQRLCSGWLWRLGLRCLRFMHLANWHSAATPIAVIGAGGPGTSIFNSAGRHVSGILSKVDTSTCSELEFQLLKYPLDRHNIQRVSAERVVSGQGIVAIYQFLRDSSKAESLQMSGKWSGRGNRSCSEDR